MTCKYFVLWKKAHDIQLTWPNLVQVIGKIWRWSTGKGESKPAESYIHASSFDIAVQKIKIMLPLLALQRTEILSHILDWLVKHDMLAGLHALDLGTHFFFLIYPITNCKQKGKASYLEAHTMFFVLFVEIL